MAKFYVETRSDGLPWTREKCNARADGDWVPWPDRPAAEAAVRARREDRTEFDDPAWATADYRIVPARKARRA